MSKISDATSQWTTIKNEKGYKKNTAKRVGDAGLAIIDAFSEISGGGNDIINITYVELVNLINNNNLTPLQCYKITDYQTVHYMFDGYNRINDINSGTIEPLIVRAISNNKLHFFAYSELYPKDTIYYDWDQNNWISNLSFSDGVNIINGFKGVIYRRIDTIKNNDIGYDFRNVKFRRWKNNDNLFTEYDFNFYYTLNESSESNDSLDYLDLYTFHPTDAYNTYEKNVFDNTIKTNGGQFFKSLLPNNVFILNGNFDSPSHQYPNTIDNNLGINVVNCTINGNGFIHNKITFAMNKIFIGGVTDNCVRILLGDVNIQNMNNSFGSVL